MRFIYYILSIVSASAFAQEAFLQHKTDKGETAYTVAKKYNITLDELKKYNSSIQEGGIKLNQLLIIPIYPKIAEIPKKTIETTAGTTTTVSTNKKYTHTVADGETVFSLCKKFNVTPEYLQNEYPEALKNGLKIGQELTFPNEPLPNKDKNSSVATSEYEYDDKNAIIHTVLAQENFYSVARKYNVSVGDIIEKNKETINGDLQVNQKIKIPNKKKTVDGRIRIINETTIFHEVKPFETKFSISRLYGITIDQLETQNPEIISVLKIGNTLAINKDLIKPKNITEELMLTLAQKQVAIEKVKVKSQEINILKERLKAQELINQKVKNIDNLNFDVNFVNIKSTDLKSSEKLKMILDTNRKLQNVLKVKLDSLILHMSQDLISLKSLPVTNIDEIKKLQEASLENVAKTNEMSQNLKKELAENRKSYTEFMEKIETIVAKENSEYKKKIKEGVTDKSKLPAPPITMEEVTNYQNSHGENDIINELLISKVDMLTERKKEVLKKQFSETNLPKKEDEQKNKTSLSNQTETKLIENKQAGQDSKLQKKEEVNKELLEKTNSVSNKTDEETQKTIKSSKPDKKEEVSEELIAKLNELIEKKVEEQKLMLKNSSTDKLANTPDQSALTNLSKYRTEAAKKQNVKLKKEETEVFTLQKMIEFLGKNPNFYKKEIAELKEIKNLKNVQNGYYIVIQDVVTPEARDKIIKKLYDDGEFGASFFYNTNSKSYLVYIDHFNTFEEFIGTVRHKDKNAYYKKIKIIKLQYQENK